MFLGHFSNVTGVQWHRAINYIRPQRQHLSAGKSVVGFGLFNGFVRKIAKR